MRFENIFLHDTGKNLKNFLQIVKDVSSTTIIKKGIIEEKANVFYSMVK